MTRPYFKDQGSLREGYTVYALLLKEIDELKRDKMERELILERYQHLFHYLNNEEWFANKRHSIPQELIQLSPIEGT